MWAATARGRACGGDGSGRSFWGDIRDDGRREVLREAVERETSTESCVLDRCGHQGRATQLEGDAPGVFPAGSRTLLVFPKPSLLSWYDNNMGGLLGTHRSAPTTLPLNLVVTWKMPNITTRKKKKKARRRKRDTHEISNWRVPTNLA
jgi:hypothetical protein